MQQEHLRLELAILFPAEFPRGPQVGGNKGSDHWLTGMGTVTLICWQELDNHMEHKKSLCNSTKFLQILVRTILQYEITFLLSH